MPAVELNGVRLHYEDEGRGPPLFLLHGGGMSAAAFSRQRPALAEQRRVLAIDSRGHGRSSDGNEPLSYALLAADVLALADHLGLDRFAVFGWSDGGVVALELAIRHPARVERVALFGTNFQVGGLTPESLQWMRNVTPETFSRELAEAYRGTSPHPERWPELIGKLKHLWLREPEYTAADLGRIRVPVLVASGDRDMVRLEHTLELFRSVPRARLAVFPSATHFVLWEQPEATCEVLSIFFRPG